MRSVKKAYSILGNTISHTEQFKRYTPLGNNIVITYLICYVNAINILTLDALLP